MAKWWISGFGLLFIITLIADEVAALNYHPPKIISSVSVSSDPDINDAGQVVWSGSHEGVEEIFLYDGSITQAIVNYPSSLNNRLPKINSKGQVTWQGFDGNDFEIFLYTDGVIQNISNNDSDDREPEINDAGQVIWRGSGSGTREIYLYSDGVARQISTTTPNPTPTYHYRINNKGQVVWASYATKEIYLYSDGEVENISNSFGSKWSPEINNLGQVVWGASGALGGDVYLYSDGAAQNISNSYGINDGAPLINDVGEMVWFIEVSSGSDDELLLYSGDIVKSISKGMYSHYNEKDINNAGQVVWDSRGHIYLYSDGVVQEIISTGDLAKINNRSQIVLLSGPNQVFLFNPIEISPPLPTAPQRGSI